MARTKCRTGIQQTKINEQFLMSRADDKTLSKINNHYPFKQYSKRHDYKVAFYKIKYKKNFIINKVSLLLKGHTERVLFFIHLRNKKNLTASKSEIIIWDQNNLKPILLVLVQSVLFILLVPMEKHSHESFLFSFLL